MKNILKQAENAERLLKLTSDTMLLLNRDGICMDIAVHNVNLWFMKEEKLLGGVWSLVRIQSPRLVIIKELS